MEGNNKLESTDSPPAKNTRQKKLSQQDSNMVDREYKREVQEGEQKQISARKKRNKSAKSGKKTRIWIRKKKKKRKKLKIKQGQ